MNRAPGSRMPRRFLSVGLSALLLAAAAAAQQDNRMGQFPWPGQFSPYGFRPVPDSNARGVPPTQPSERAPLNLAPGTSPFQFGPPPWSQPGQQTGMPYAQTQPRASSTPPRLITRIAAGPVYVQQTLVLTLEVVSGANLQTIDPILPRTDSLVFRKMGTWEANARVRDGGREIVNSLRFLVTPLRAGEQLLEPVRVAGKTAEGQDFQAVASTPLELQVLPPEPGVLPWLPLTELEVHARLLNDRDIKDGKPLTLIVEQRAVGASGSQLPSLEPQLREGNFRLYREDSELDGRITREGRLEGTRIDTFTLVPKKGRELLIPTVRIVWWNTAQQRAETAILPSRLLNPGDSLMGDLSEQLGGGPFVAGSSWVFWLPLTVFAFVMGLYWTWIWAKGRRIGERLRLSLADSLSPARSRLGRWLARLSPRRYLHVARRRFANSLPRAYRLWYCVRAADAEKDPADWSQVLRFLVQRRLGAPAQVPMPQLAEIIIDIHPGARPERVRALLGELSAALFGTTQIRDFARWKREFKREIRPRLFGLRLARRGSAPGEALPELNP
ncbi:MAG: hypothetical protein RLZ44_585 [Pseudomonadota bacterium]